MTTIPKINLSAKAKIALLLAVVAGGIAAFFIIKRNFKNIKNTQDSKKEVSETNDVLSQLAKDGKKGTIDGLKIQTVANSIFTAMDGIGTDIHGVYRAFANINNDVDMVNVIKAYGVRELSSGKFNPVPNIKGTLSQAITEELNSEEVQALNGMLANKGIKYRF